MSASTPVNRRAARANARDIGILTTAPPRANNACSGCQRCVTCVAALTAAVGDVSACDVNDGVLSSSHALGVSTLAGTGGAALLPADAVSVAAKWSVDDGDAAMRTWKSLAEAAPATRRAAGSDILVTDNCDASELYVCLVAGCGAALDSAAQLAAHSVQHLHRCTSCGAAFLTARWVAMHAEEEHSSLFLALAARREMFECPIEGCAKRCWRADDRRKHMMDKHRIPAAAFSPPPPPATHPSAAAHSGSGDSAPHHLPELQSNAFDPDLCASSAADAAAAAGGGDREVSRERCHPCSKSARGKTIGSGHAGRHAAGMGTARLHAQRAGLPPARSDGGGARSPQATALLPCRFWQTAVGCRNAAACPFAHVAEAGAAKACPPLPCRFWSTPAGCRNAAACPFSHKPGDGTITAAAAVAAVAASRAAAAGAVARSPGGGGGSLVERSASGATWNGTAYAGAGMDEDGDTGADDAKGSTVASKVHSSHAGEGGEESGQSGRRSHGSRLRGENAAGAGSCLFMPVSFGRGRGINRMTAL